MGVERSGRCQTRSTGPWWRGSISQLKGKLGNNNKQYESLSRAMWVGSGCCNEAAQTERLEHQTLTVSQLWGPDVRG